MSKISELRDNDNNKINFIKIIETYVSDTKYITMYQKLFKNMLQENYSILQTKESLIRLLPEVNQEKLDSLNDLEIIFLYILTTSIVPGDTNNEFSLFCKYNNENKIKQNDLQTYCSFSEIKEEVRIIKEKEKEKELEKQIIKLFEDDVWLILKPFTHEASLKYGANTKWCTASKDEASYFRRYTSNGILIYCINKIKNEKYAIHRSISDNSITYWDYKDNEISIFDINLSGDAFAAINNGLKSNISNTKQYHSSIVKKEVERVKEYKSKSKLLDEVAKQYNENKRWGAYIEFKNRDRNYRF